MTQMTSRQSFQPRLQNLFVGATALLLMIALVWWAGLPHGQALIPFTIGVLILIVMLFGFAFLFWHLMLRPLPAHHTIPATNTLPATYRQLIALLVGISGMNLVVGGFWDEVWHRVYGIPFGEDLLWRPHLLIYSSFAIVSILAGIAFVYLLKKGRGTLQQRFRANPVLGLLILLGGFQVYAVVADPLWHIIYGEDITAWSLPHLLLVLDFMVVMIAAAAIQLSTLPEGSWAGIWQKTPREWFIGLVLAFVLLVGLQVMATEWEGQGAFSRVILRRPEWMLPAVIMTFAVFAGTLANHAMRAYGAATLIGMIALTIRLSLVQAFGIRSMSADAWTAALPPLLALDLWYGLRVLTTRRPPSWVTGGVAATIGLIVGTFPLINHLYPYPNVTMTNLPSFVLAGLITALGACWSGRAVGEYLATHNKHVEEVAGVDRRLRLVPPLAFVAVVSFILVFIATAPPPS